MKWLINASWGGYDFPNDDEAAEWLKGVRRYIRKNKPSSVISVSVKYPGDLDAIDVHAKMEDGSTIDVGFDAIELELFPEDIEADSEAILGKILDTYDYVNN